MDKPQALYDLCKANEKYRELWDRLANQADTPNKQKCIGQRKRSVSPTIARWLDAGQPVRSNERQHEILESICRQCPEHVTGEGCKCDGCGKMTAKYALLAHIRMETEHCPLDPPKW
jgi:hypothetical protein